MKHIIVTHSNTINIGGGVYDSECYWLEYKQESQDEECESETIFFPFETDLLQRAANAQVFMIFDTLTLTFKAPTGSFVSLDAYTNYDQWVHKRIDLPQSITATIRANPELFLDDNRVSFSYTPKYFFDKKQHLLEIIVSDEIQDSFVKCSSNLIFGLKEDTIRSLYLSDIKFV